MSFWNWADLVLHSWHDSCVSKTWPVSNFKATHKWLCESILREWILQGVPTKSLGSCSAPQMLTAWSTHMSFTTTGCSLGKKKKWNLITADKTASRLQFGKHSTRIFEKSLLTLSGTLLKSEKMLYLKLKYQKCTLARSRQHSQFL